MNIKYSVIIPVYNAEKTLDRCLHSLVNQQRFDVEIVLVNDGSVDSSGTICCRYCREYANITYVQQENSGVSAARNKGLSAATGQYILFVDSDDYVSGEYFSQIDQLLGLHDTDLIIFSQYDCKNGDIAEIKYEPFFTDEPKELYNKISDLICRKNINTPWGKVYKKEIIERYHVNFTEGVSIAEDRAFNIKYALHIKNLRVIDSPLYYVSLDNGESLSRKKKENFNGQTEIVRNDINEAIANSDLSDEEKQYFVDALNFGECRGVYTYAKMYWQANDKRSVRIKKIKQLCKKINARHDSYPKTRYCRLITLPVRFELAWVIDVMAWKLTHSG